MAPRLYGGVGLADPWSEGEGVFLVANLLWDTNSLAWVKQTASTGVGNAVTIADGADACEGATTDAAVVGDVGGTLAAKIRGLSKILNDVWNSGSHQLQVSSTAGASTCYDGQQAVTNVAAALPSHAGSQVTVKALRSNQEVVYVGPSTVTVGNGYELWPGDLVTLNVTNSNGVYVISNAGGNVCFVGS